MDEGVRFELEDEVAATREEDESKDLVKSTHVDCKPRGEKLGFSEFDAGRCVCNLYMRRFTGSSLVCVCRW